MKNVFRFLTSIFFISLISAQAFCQVYLSTQPHEDQVTSILYIQSSNDGDESFYSTGNDGFIIKWGSDGIGEHYQITDLKIKLLAQNPVTKDLAVYETDGVATHRVCVYDCKSFARKYSKKYKDSVTSLTFSEKGTYLIVGTAAVNGTYILNARTGAVAKKTTDITGMISLARTGSSEKNAIMYSPSGNIIYYDLTTLKVVKKLNTEPMLDQPTLLGTKKTNTYLRFLAGVKNNTIYVIDTNNGKIIAQYSANNPYVLSSKSEYEDGMYFITYTGKNYVLNTVSLETLASQIGASSSKVMNPPDPLLVKKFIGLKSKDKFTYVTKTISQIILGTSSGNIYTMTSIPESETFTLFPITEKMYEKIYDIDTDKKDFYILTSNSVYKSSYDDKTIELAASNSSQTNCIKYEDTIILWSKNTKRAVQQVGIQSEGTSSAVTLFTPAKDLQNVRICGNSIISIQGNSSVYIYDLTTGKYSEVYAGTSVQDAILLNNNELYVAKTSTGSSDPALITVNTETMETVPLKVTGNVVFSLSYDFASNDSNLYGIRMKTENDETYSEVFGFNTQTKLLTTITKTKEEDSSAFMVYQKPVIYNNLGKNQIQAYNLNTKRSILYRRSASMPLKIVSASDRIAVLNMDGSLSWYNPNMQAVLSNWYLTIGGDWFESD